MTAAEPPTYGADTALPAGKTCGDCRHIKRCKTMFGHTETGSPSRFGAAQEIGHV